MKFDDLYDDLMESTAINAVTGDEWNNPNVFKKVTRAQKASRDAAIQFPGKDAINKFFKGQEKKLKNNPRYTAERERHAAAVANMKKVRKEGISKPKDLGEVEMSADELNDLRQHNAKRFHDMKRRSYNISNKKSNNVFADLLGGLVRPIRKATSGKSYTSTSDGKLKERQ